MKFGFYLPALLLTAAVPAAWAGLEFEHPVQKTVVKVADQEIGTRFSFKVTGDKPVRITDIRTFCSCVRAQTGDGKVVYQPGESGVIDAAFEVGGFEGEVKKEVVVTTDEAGTQPIRLVLEVDIARLMEVTPAQLVWQVGAPAEAKQVRVRVLGGETLRVVKAESSRQGMSVTMKEVTPGKEYELTVTPETTAAKLLGMVKIVTDSPYPRYQKRLIFFNITDKAPVPAATAVAR